MAVPEGIAEDDRPSWNWAKFNQTNPWTGNLISREASKRLGLRSMIVLQELPDGRWGYTSYGATKALCGRARDVADRALHEVMEDVSAESPE